MAPSSKAPPMPTAVSATHAAASQSWGRDPVAWAFILTSTVLIVGAVVVFGTYSSTRDANARVAQTLSLIHGLEQVLSTLKDAETGQRGFLLTGREEYLGPYDAAGASLDAHLEAVRVLTAADPDQQSRLALMEDAARHLRSVSDESIRFWQAGDMDAALAVVDSGVGKKLMDEIRRIMKDMEAEERRHLAERRAAADAYQTRSVVAAAATAILLASVLALAFFTQRMAGRTLRESEALFRSAFDHTNVAMVLTDMDNRFVRVNAAFARLFGREPADMLGVSMQDVTHPDDVAESLAQRQELLAGRGHYFQVEKRYAGPDGEVRWGLTNVALLRGPDGAPFRYVAQVQDITARKHAEEELRRLNAELEDRVGTRTAELRASNEELESFSYSVSHDLRAPLRAVDGFARIVLEDFAGQLPEDASEYLRDIRVNSLKMGRLVDDLLAFSRLGKQVVKRHALDMTALAEACLEELTVPRPPDQLDVRVAALPPCVGDHSLLKQVWLNLLANALKYSAKKAKAVVEVGALPGPVYFVRDNGVGFDMKYAHKLFGVFHRLHREEDYAGTGVGLAIVHRIVQRHGGRVWAEAAPDKGATFFFTVGPAPVAGSPAE